MADFTKRFRRAPNDQGGAVLAPPPPPPAAPQADETQRLDPTGDQPHYGGAAAPVSRPETAAPAREADAEPAIPAAAEVRARQRDEFGGFNWGSAFFGWLVAIGLGALLTAAVTGTGAAVGLTESDATTNAETIGVGGGILLLIVATIAWYCGGYVAGRMSRFDGARQGFGVWLFGAIAAVVIAAAGWILGDEYNLLDRLDLPRIPIDAGDVTTGGLIALAAILFGTLLAAVAGGRFGQRYHTRIDRHGFGESCR